MLRREALCPGASVCPEAQVPGDPSLPCALCPEQLLLQYQATPMGRLIANVIDVDFALQVRMHVSLGDLLYPEFFLLRQLVEERSKYEEEQIKKKSQH